MKTVKSIRQNKPLKEGFKSPASQMPVTGFSYSVNLNNNGTVTITSKPKQIRGK